MKPSSAIWFRENFVFRTQTVSWIAVEPLQRMKIPSTMKGTYKGINGNFRKSHLNIPILWKQPRDFGGPRSDLTSRIPRLFPEVGKVYMHKAQKGILNFIKGISANKAPFRIHLFFPLKWTSGGIHLFVWKKNVPSYSLKSQTYIKQRFIHSKNWI